MKYFSVYITTKDKEEARKIGTALVSLRLAACANIIASAESIYRWQNRIRNEKEAILITKTKESAIANLIEKVKALHSYKNPAIVVWPIVHGVKEYLEWIEKEVL